MGRPERREKPGDGSPIIEIGGVADFRELGQEELVVISFESLLVYVRRVCD